ncbi:MAG TPA: sulfatase-like hydrolase/transferase, partial [Vicinamibacteria bacterium]|nr:sulfatase-like hydrolase/transferase [Vicinamibacteria bacterium]
MRRRSLVVLSLSAVAACHSAPPRGPQKLADLPTASGSPPSTVAVRVAEETRQGLAERTLIRAFLPRRGLLSFGLAAAGGPESPLLEVTLRSEGRVLGRRGLDPRTRPFDHASIGFEGPGRAGILEVDLRLTDPSGRTVPQPSSGPAAITDATLFDRDAIRGIVLVSIDTLRRDHVGFYGYPRATTPRLDALARQGLVFHDAVSVSSWTLPAHLSMLTSVVPARHGGVDGHHGFNGSVPPLAETLRRAGFITHAITSHV